MSRAVSPKSLERLRDPAAPLAPRSPLQHTQTDTDTQREDSRPDLDMESRHYHGSGHGPTNLFLRSISSRVSALDIPLRVRALPPPEVPTDSPEDPAAVAASDRFLGGLSEGGGRLPLDGPALNPRYAFGEDCGETRREETRQFRPREGRREGERTRGKGQGERERAGARTRTSWLFSSMSTSLSSMASSRRPDLSRSLPWRWRLSLLRRKGQGNRRVCMGGEDQRR